MTNDYAKHKKKAKPLKGKAKNKRKVPPKKPASSPFVWLGIGLLVLGFIAFLYFLSKQPMPDASASAPSQKSAPIKPETPAQHRFEFYDMLKDQTVDVNPQQSQSDSKTPKEPVNLFLQVGSFKTQQDADRHRAQVLLLNLTAWIEKSNGSNGITWYRVISGPYTSSSSLAKARSTLIAQQIDTLVIKRKQ